MIIAIDGGVASGKSAVGRRVAAALELPFIDSGLMYRAIAQLAHSGPVEVGDPSQLTRLAERTRLQVDHKRVWADDVELTDRVYDPSLNEALATVSATAGVRRVLVARQRAMAGGGVVMAGRDIGTVVFPDADFKFFLAASLEEKVRRRVAQMELRGQRLAPSALSAEVVERDRRDTEREDSPLRPAADAVLIETDGRSLDQVVAGVLLRIGR